MMKLRKLVRRNPVARALRDPMFRKRVVKDKTKYDRKRPRRDA